MSKVLLTQTRVAWGLSLHASLAVCPPSWQDLEGDTPVPANIQRAYESPRHLAHRRILSQQVQGGA